MTSQCFLLFGISIIVFYEKLGQEYGILFKNAIVLLVYFPKKWYIELEHDIVLTGEQYHQRLAYPITWIKRKRESAP